MCTPNPGLGITFYLNNFHQFLDNVWAALTPHLLTSASLSAPDQELAGSFLKKQIVEIFFCFSFVCLSVGQSLFGLVADFLPDVEV